MEPFGIQIVIYLFLAGVAAGAAFMGSLALTSGKPGPFRAGRRSVVLALFCAAAGAVFLILDLTRPADFFLILTTANASSAISWGARILVLFTLCALFVWVAVRHWSAADMERGFKGFDALGLWLLRASALGLAIYPAFVLRQGEAFALWQSPIVIPLIAVSSFHGGIAAMILLNAGASFRSRARGWEICLGVVQLTLLLSIFIAEGGTAFAWAVALGVGTLLPLIFVFVKPGSALAPRVLLVLLGTFALRYWLISAGQVL